MPRLSIGLEQVFTNLGIVGNGYKLFFFETGTMTPKTTYSNQGLSVQNSNPIVLNEAGRPDVGIWGSDPSLYRMILGTPESVLGNISVVVDVDPVDNYSVNNIAGLTPIPTAFWGTTGGTSSNYTLDPALVDITSYSNEQTFFIDFHTACAANPDIDINGLGALDLKKKTGQGTKVGLLEGDVNGRHICTNDGTDIIILDPRSAATYLGKAPTVTISSGVVTLPNSAGVYLVDTEAAAAIDSLDTINGLTTGETARLMLANAARKVTLTNSGNITTGQSSITLSSVNEVVEIYSPDGSNVYVTNAKLNTRFALITYQVSNGTAGGTSTGGSFQTRPLNTVSQETVEDFISLSSNQITLQPGFYQISAQSLFWEENQNTNGVRSRIRDITNSATVGLSLSGQINLTEPNTTLNYMSIIPSFTLTVSATTVYELQYFVTTGQATNGLGVPSSSGEVEVYASVLIQRVNQQ